MIGRKEKKRWSELADYFAELEDSLTPLQLSSAPLRSLQVPAAPETEEKVPVATAQDTEEEVSQATPDAGETPAELGPAEVPRTVLLPPLVEVKAPVETEDPSDSLSPALLPPTPDQWLNEPAQQFFGRLDWSGAGLARPVAHPEPALTSPGRIAGLSAQQYFGSLPWDGNAGPQAARGFPSASLDRLMEAATRQALRTAQARSGKVIPLPQRSSARHYFSHIPWQKAADSTKG